MKTYLEIVADSNDADYVTQRTEISDEDLARIQPVIDAIKDRAKKNKSWNDRHNWETSEYGSERPEVMYGEEHGGPLSEELIEEFNEYVPYGEYGVHTITEINLIKIAEERSLLHD